MLNPGVSIGLPVFAHRHTRTYIASHIALRICAPPHLYYLPKCNRTLTCLPNSALNYLCIYRFTGPSISTRAHMYIYIYIYTRTYFCIVSPHLSIQAYLYWVPTCPCTPIFRGLNMSLSTYFRMWTSLHTDIYIYIYIYIYMRRGPWIPAWPIYLLLPSPL